MKADEPIKLASIEVSQEETILEAEAEINRELAVSTSVSMPPQVLSEETVPLESDKPAQPEEKKQSLGKTFGLVAFLTILSKVAGLIRDIVILQAFGTNWLSDAYNFAYQMTGNILILFGGLGGPFHSSTVAVLNPRKNDPDSGRLMTQLFIITVSFLAFASLLAYVFSPQLIAFLFPAGNVTVEARTALWAEVTKQFNIMLPLITISGIVGLSYGILNVYNKILWPSLSPAIASLAIIIAVFFFSDQYGIICLAFATLIGAIGQAVVQIPGMIKTPLKWSLSSKPHPGLKEFLLMLGPAAFSTSIGQLNTFIDSNFTSQLQEGGWTAIVNANRLIQLPLGVLLTAMLVPILPRFTEHVTNNKIDDLKLEFSRALRILWFLGLPMMAMFIAIPGPIVSLLFERGKFTAHSTELLSLVLIFLAPSIFFYLARDLITRIFYAHQDSKTPFLVALVVMGVHYCLDWLMVVQFKMGIEGIALASTFVTIFNLTCLSFFARRKIGRFGITRLIVPTAIMLTASAACGGASWYIHGQLWATLHSGSVAQTMAALPLSPGILNILTKALCLGVAAGIGLLIYLIICIIFKLEEPSAVASRFLKKRKSPST